MANNYLQFSEVLPSLTPDEEAWLRRQLEVVCVFGDREYAEDEVPDELDADPDWRGYRAWRDMEDCDPDEADQIGFQYAFHDDHPPPEGWGRHLWLYTEEWGMPGRVAHLVQKFLKEFRPEECWALTYATTCSKPRVGECGGGGMFVTANEIKWQDGRDFAETEAHRFSQRQEETSRSKLLALARKQGLTEEDLEEAVHDAASEQAASVNNGGLAGQIAYLVEQLGPAETQGLLERLTQGKPTDDQTPPDGA